MITERQIVALAEHYGSLVGISLKTVSSRVLSDGKVLPRIREGRGSITMTRAERAWRWFQDNWPEKADWPIGIPRPSGDVGDLAAVASDRANWGAVEKNADFDQREIDAIEGAPS